jgi:preprotein translocase subunit YajC
MPDSPCSADRPGLRSGLDLPGRRFPILTGVAASLAASAALFADDAPSLAGSPAAGAAPATGAGTGGAGPTAAGAGNNSFMLLFLGLLVAWVLILVWGSRREQKKKQALLAGIKKHDRVQTVGGVIGSVVELKPDIVVLKVDEHSNTRITFARSAIIGVVKESPAEPASASKDVATARQG